jgi:peptide/nickel transport system permease protein
VAILSVLRLAFGSLRVSEEEEIDGLDLSQHSENAYGVAAGGGVPEGVPSGGLGLGVTPIGPTWDPEHYFLGADNQGRDVSARLLYGGRNSLLIGVSAALLTCLLGTLIGLAAGFFGGSVDAVLSRLLDVVWAFPVYLFAICLSTVLITNNLRVGPYTLESGSLLLPIVIIGIVCVPCVGRSVAKVLSSAAEFARRQAEPTRRGACSGKFPECHHGDRSCR